MFFTWKKKKKNQKRNKKNHFLHFVKKENNRKADEEQLMCVFVSKWINKRTEREEMSHQRKEKNCRWISYRGSESFAISFPLSICVVFCVCSRSHQRPNERNKKSTDRHRSERKKKQT